jgi:hypothetical protein
MILPCFTASVLLLSAMALTNRVQAGQMVFAIDPTRSQLTLSGKIAGNAFTTQEAGSLTTTYSGNINANISGSTIQFTGSSTITAATNGVWQPAVGGGSGSATADYGAEATVEFLGTAYGALRNIILDVTSSSLPLTGTNFDSGALIFLFSSGSSSALDYNAILEHGTLSLAGYSTNTIANEASLTTNGNVEQLVIQINTQFAFTLVSPGDTPLDLVGQLVATNLSVVSASPFINSVIVTNQNVVLTVENATTQSELLSSTNLMTWASASATVSSNSGTVTFTVPVSGPHDFFRIQK